MWQGAAIAGGAALAGGILGTSAQKKAAEASAAAMREATAESRRQFDISQEIMDKAAQRLEEQLLIPPIDAQKIILEYPQLAGIEDFQALPPSAFEGIETDPRLEGVQFETLDRLGAIGRGEVSTEEMLQREAIKIGASQDATARQKAIASKYAARGQTGAGQQMVEEQLSAQGAAQTSYLGNLQARADQEKRALEAIAMRGGMAGDIRGQAFGEAAAKASASDVIAKFNQAQQQEVARRNLERRQDIANQQTSLANQQEMYNKALMQQQFQNQLAKEQSIANIRTGQATQAQKQANVVSEMGKAQAEGIAQQGAAKAGLYGDLAGSLIKAGSQINFDKNKEKKDDYADGGIMRDKAEARKKAIMALQSKYKPYVTAEDGIIIEAGEDPDNYAGDEVNAHVNDKEMILNVAQQQNLVDIIQGEAPAYPSQETEETNNRVDTKLERGELQLNTQQQNALFEYIKGNIPELPPGDIIEGDDQLALPAEPTTPQMSPEQMIPMAPTAQPQAPAPTFANGGIQKAESDLQNKLAKKKAKLKRQEEELGNATKNTKAQIKALETLLGETSV